MSKSPHAARRVAEYVLFVASLLLILALAGLFLYEGFTSRETAVPIEVVVGSPQALHSPANAAQTAVVPINVHNRGGQTLRELTLRIKRGQDEWEVLLEYLQEQSTQTIYVAVSGPEEPVEARSLSYTLE